MRKKHHWKVISVFAIIIVGFLLIYVRNKSGEDAYREGWEYEKGLGNLPDYANAIRCYQVAAAIGHIEAQKHLAYIYENGLGVERDIDAAVSWYKKAAGNGDYYSAAKIGLLLSDKDNKNDDFVEADKWLTIAIEHGEKNLAENRRDYLETAMTPEDIMRARIMAKKFNASPNHWKFKQFLMPS